MNPQSIVAFILAGAVLVFGVLSAGNPRTFLDAHALLIVMGGTVAASAISFQIDRIALLFKVFFRRVIQGKKEDYVKLIEELMVLADAYRTRSPKLEQLVARSEDHFIKEAMAALEDQILDEGSLIRVLRTRAATIFQRQSEEVVKFKTIGRYPPAFGLLGTTLSMITLLGRLGEPGAQNLLGPAMSMGLVATFYGLAFANLVFAPIAENLADSAKENRLKNMIIVEGMRLIQKKTNPVVLAEELNSFLLPSERIDWKKVAGGGAQKKAA